MRGGKRVFVATFIILSFLLLLVPSLKSNSREMELLAFKTADLKVHWNRTFDLVDHDVFGDISACTDGGFALVARTLTSGDENVWLIRTDSYGNMLWNYTYWGGISNPLVIEVSEGGFAIATKNPEGYGDQLIRINANGDKLWNRTHYREEIDHDVLPTSIIECETGGFALAGQYRETHWYTRNALLLRTDNSGNELWRRGFGESGLESSYESFNDIIECSGGGFLLVGYHYTWDDPYGWFFVVRTDENGDAIWEKTFGHPGESDEAYSTIECDDGGFVIAGTYLKSSKYMGYVMKIDQNGNDEWNKTYSIGDETTLAKVIRCSNGGLAFSGYSYNPPFGECLLIRTDDEGNILWQMETHPPYGCLSNGIVVETDDGGFVLAVQAQFTVQEGQQNVWMVYISEESPTTSTTTSTITVQDDIPSAILLGLGVGGLALSAIVIVFLKKRKS